MASPWSCLPLGQQCNPIQKHSYPGVDYRLSPAPVKDASTQTNGHGSIQNSPQQDCRYPDSLSQAFAAAQVALHPFHRLSDTLPQSALATGQVSTPRPRKRKADAPPLPPARKPKKQKVNNTPNQLQFRLKKPGRPRKLLAARPKTSFPKLSQKHPLQTGIPIDIWHCIILNSPLSFVFKTKDVSSDIRALLTDKSSVWKDVRQSTYGSDHPDPPVGLTEQQYADLLVGFGCQDKHCDDKKARKVYWAFQRRWCIACVKKNIVMEGACKVILDKYPEPTKYLDTAIFDGWGHYSGISVPDENKISTNRALGYKRAFLRTEIARLTQQMEIIQGDISTETLDSSDAYKDLIAAMKGANEKSLKKLQPIEDWAETYRRANDVESKSKKRRKFDFFADKALFMAPPIDRETLERMECFHAAVAAASGPSERAWKSVEKKLQAQLAKTAASLAMVEENNRPSQEEYRALVKRREDNNTSEQVAILALADEVLKSLVEGPDSIRVADEDFVRIVLKRTYELHQENKGEEGYALLMDDASMIFKRKIEPIIKGWQDGTKKRAALGLRCPGCKKGTKQTYTFDKLIHHIFWKHSGRIGDYDCFRFGKESSDEFRTRSEFLWCYIKWPRNLPILSAGQNAGGAWDIHAAVEEHYSPPSSRSVEPDPSVGAFDNRLATNCVGSKSPNLVNDIQFILDRFESIDLPDRFKTQIALEFACQRFETQDKHEPPLSLLKDLRLMLLRKGFKGVFERFRCRVCCDETREDGRNGYFARSLKSLDQLSDHFRSEHSKHCWTREMLDLPTPQELLTELQQPSNHEACTLFDCFFPSIPSATLDPNVQHVAAADTIESMDSEMFDDSEEESESAEEHEDMEESEDSYAIYNYQDFAKHQERGVSPG